MWVCTCTHCMRLQQVRIWSVFFCWFLHFTYIRHDLDDAYMWHWANYYYVFFWTIFPWKFFSNIFYFLWWQGVSRWAHSLGMWGIFKIAWTWSCPGPSAELVILFILICFDLWCGFYPLYVTSAPYLSLLLLNAALLHKYKHINSHTNTLQPTTSLYRNSPHIRSL